MASVSQRKQLARTQSRVCQRVKEQSHLSKSSDREVGESQGEREPHLGKRESEREHRKKRVVSTVKRGRFQERKGWHARRTSLGEVGESMSG